jgi:hypothetical protein
MVGMVQNRVTLFLNNTFLDPMAYCLMTYGKTTNGVIYSEQTLQTAGAKYDVR